MSATIDINGTQASINGGKWFCYDLALLNTLNSLYPSSYLPDEVNAREAIAQLGGMLISADPELDDADDDGILIVH
jgi:hypothetical protein